MQNTNSQRALPSWFLAKSWRLSQCVHNAATCYLVFQEDFLAQFSVRCLKRLNILSIGSSYKKVCDVLNLCTVQQPVSQQLLYCRTQILRLFLGFKQSKNIFKNDLIGISAKVFCAFSVRASCTRNRFSRSCCRLSDDCRFRLSDDLKQF